MSPAGALLLASGAGADRIHHTLCAFAEVLRVDLFPLSTFRALR